MKGAQKSIFVKNACDYRYQRPKVSLKQLLDKTKTFFKILINVLPPPLQNIKFYTLRIA